MSKKFNLTSTCEETSFLFCFFYFRKDNYLVAFKDVGTIRKLKIRLQENPDGSYFDGWTVAKVRFTETTVHLTNRSTNMQELNFIKYTRRKV